MEFWEFAQAHLDKLLICHYGWDKGAKTVKIISVAIYSRSNLRLTGLIVRITRLLHVELAHNLQSPGIPSHTQVREPQSAMRRQEQPPVRVGEVPAVQWRP